MLGVGLSEPAWLSQELRRDAVRLSVNPTTRDRGDLPDMSLAWYEAAVNDRRSMEGMDR